MSKISVPVGIYVIASGVLLGIAVAVIVIALLDENDAGGGQSAVVAILSFIGTSGTTIGVGVLVILMGRILAALDRG